MLSLLGPQKTRGVILAIMRENFDILGPILAIDGKAIHDKTNEIPVFQKFLDTLNVQGKTITAGAMHCQKETEEISFYSK